MGLTVLLIDDEEELVSSMSERLSFRGIDARYATTGLEGLRVAGEQKFDAVVLDVKMPGLSGIKLMRRLEQVQEGLHFIFLTGHGSESDFRDCCEAGASSYLVKPVDIDDLIQKIREALA
jgi:DNA-binding response OmpR family regulator